MVTSVDVSLWRSRYSISCARSAVLTVTRIAPILASANCSTIHSGTLVAQTATRSPGSTPRRHQPARDQPRLVVQRAERPALAGVAVDERLAAGQASARRRQQRADGDVAIRATRGLWTAADVAQAGLEARPHTRMRAQVAGRPALGAGLTTLSNRTLMNANPVAISIRMPPLAIALWQTIRTCSTGRGVDLDRVGLSVLCALMR